MKAIQIFWWYFLNDESANTITEKVAEFTGCIFVTMIFAYTSKWVSAHLGLRVFSDYTYTVAFDCLV